MRYGLLGPVEVRTDRGELALGGERTRCVLAVLLLNANRVVSAHRRGQGVDRVLTDEEIAPMAATLVGRWRLDGDGTDATPYARDLTPGDGVAWTEDRGSTPDSAADLDGAGNRLSTAGPVLRTDQSYTLMGWVRLDALPTSDQTLVSQDGQCVSAMNSGVVMAGTPRWGMSTRSTDCAGTPTWPRMYSPVALTANDVGDWVHLAAVYDATAATDKLFVNGVQVTAVAGLTTAGFWPSTGPLSIGSGQFWGVRTGFLNASVDDIRVYAGPMTAGQVKFTCAC